MAALLRLAGAIAAVSATVGRAVRWLAVVVVLLQFVVVLLRYAYGTSYVWMQEGVIYLHAALFMLAIGYTYMLDGHVRVDVLYAGWSPRRRALVDLVGILVSVLPFCVLLVWASWGYVAMSWRFGEGPMRVGGLPLQPWLKTLIPAMAGLLALQAVAVAIRCVAVLAGRAETHVPARPAAASHG